MDAQFHDAVGGLERGVGVAAGLALSHPDVGAPRLVEERRVRQHRPLRIDDGRQRLVGHVHQLGGVAGAVPCLGDDHRHRIADVTHLVYCQRAALHQLDVLERVERDFGGQRGVDGSREIGSRVERHHAGRCQGGRSVNRDDPGVGVRAPHDVQERHPRQCQVVHEAGRAGDEARVFAAADRLAEQPGERGSRGRHQHPSTGQMACERGTLPRIDGPPGSPAPV